MDRHHCDNCNTRMEDIEEINFNVFEKCDRCRNLAIEWWQFVIRCTGELGERMFKSKFAAFVEHQKLEKEKRRRKKK